MFTNRRQFLASAAALSATYSARRIRAQAASSCNFRLAVINDEISPDFDHACFVAAHDFGLHWIELRSMWGKNVTALNAAEIAESQKILAKYKLQVTDIASPLFKGEFPGAPRSKEAPKRATYTPPTDLKDQDALLDHCIELAKAFGTDRIRCFDFLRLEDPAPFRAAINAKLTEAAQTCAKHDIVLLLENEMACNTGSGEEAAQVLAAIPNRNFMLNWDPGNAGTFPGNVPYPDAYAKLPKDRIGHCHVKNVKRDVDGKPFAWQPVDIGLVDWTAQFRALARDGFHYGVSLETHWRGGGTAEASTRTSMKGMQDCLMKAGLHCA